MKQNGSWDSKSDPFGDFTIIFEAANNNIKILNYPVRYYARKSGAPNISRWIDGLKLLKVCWIYMISDILISINFQKYILKIFNFAELVIK